MSTAALNWAFDLAMDKSSDKFVLVALADYADENGNAYPSIQTLERKTCLNRKTIISAISRLCSLGYLADTGKRKGQTQSVKVYRLCRLSSPKTGTTKEAKTEPETPPKTTPKEPLSDTENGTPKAVPKTGAVPELGAVPKTDGSSTVFTDKQSQKRDTEPSENHQGTTSIAWTLPDSVDQVAWAEFEQHRREIKKPLTDLARTKAANQLKNLSPEQQQQCIDISIQSRWPGLYPNKVKNEKSIQPFARPQDGRAAASKLVHDLAFGNSTG